MHIYCVKCYQNFPNFYSLYLRILHQQVRLTSFCVGMLKWFAQMKVKLIVLFNFCALTNNIVSNVC